MNAGVRLAWVSDRARAVWEPRLARIGDAWCQIEIESVRRGLRRCALTVIPAFRFFELSAKLTRDGLVAQTTQSVPASALNRRGHGLFLRVAIGTRSDVSALADAALRCDDDAIGRLLGYPDCCIASFRRHWVERRETDSTFSAASASIYDADGSGTTLSIQSAAQTNLLWRWLGVRFVPHLVCAFDCAASIESGSAFAAIGIEAGFADEMRWSSQMLSWPVEWSALHGIAEVRTPVVKFMTTTDTTDRKRVVRVAGTSYPALGARGVTFPYSRATTMPVDVDSIETDLHRDNGFATEGAMHAAHAPLVALASGVVTGPAHAVLDLGCGNGALLDKICRGTGAPAFGIDLDLRNCERARRLYPAGTWTSGDLFVEPSIWNRSYRLVLVSAARLGEVSRETRDLLESRIKTTAEYVLVYAYPGTIMDARILENSAYRLIEGNGNAVLLRTRHELKARKTP